MKSEDLDRYIPCYPIWIDYHIDTVAASLAGMSAEQREKVILEEVAKLNRFCEIMCNRNVSHFEAEKEVYGEHKQFYYLMKRKTDAYWKRKEKEWELERQKRKEVEEERKREEQLKRELQEPETGFPERDCYPENDLTYKMRERLIKVGFKRLKVSPYGDSGAAFYWLKTRYNESKLHAFFCYLIESEAKKHVRTVDLHITDGPDVVFEFKGRKYCFDVETGKNLARNKDILERKFERYRASYYGSFVFVTNKRLKYKYSKYAKVVTRATLKDTLNTIFST